MKLYLWIRQRSVTSYACWVPGSTVQCQTAVVQAESVVKQTHTHTHHVTIAFITSWFTPGMVLWPRVYFVCPTCGWFLLAGVGGDERPPTGLDQQWFTITDGCVPTRGSNLGNVNTH